jgi:hypothetical protein
VAIMDLALGFVFVVKKTIGSLYHLFTISHVYYNNM